MTKKDFDFESALKQLQSGKPLTGKEGICPINQTTRRSGKHRPEKISAAHALRRYSTLERPRADARSNFRRRCRRNCGRPPAETL